MRPLPILVRILVPVAVAGTLAACDASDRGGYGHGGGLGGIFGGGYGGDRVSYRCEDDRRLAVTYYRDGATVAAGDHRYDLREEGRGRYSSRDGDVQLEADRRRAYLRVKDEKDYQECRAL
jgi:hypothetical protein